MKYPLLTIYLTLATLGACHAGTQNVVQDQATKALLTDVAIAAGKTITINGTIINNGTATGFGGSFGSLTGMPSDNTPLQTVLDSKLGASAAASLYVSTSGSYANPSWLTQLSWSKISFRPTTMAGYGIAGPASPYQTGLMMWQDTFWNLDPTASAVRTRIGLGNVENTALSTWSGSANITTLGTISTGMIPVANGGTNASTAAGARASLLPGTSGNADKVLTVNSAGSDYELRTPAATGIGGSTGSTANAIILASGTGGSTAQGSTATIDASGNLRINGTAGFTVPMLRIGADDTGIASIGSNRIDLVTEGAQMLTIPKYGWVSCPGGPGIAASRFNFDPNNAGTGAFMSAGNGSPEGVIEAPVGSIYCRLNGGANSTLYIKESGTGNTGWIAK